MKEWVWIVLGIGVAVGLLMLATPLEPTLLLGPAREPISTDCQATVWVESVRVVSPPDIGDEWSHYIRIEDGDWIVAHSGVVLPSVAVQGTRKLSVVAMSIETDRPSEDLAPGSSLHDVGTRRAVFDIDCVHKASGKETKVLQVSVRESHGSEAGTIAHCEFVIHIEVRR